jgi:hypothetical protein
MYSVYLSDAQSSYSTTYPLIKSWHALHTVSASSCTIPIMQYCISCGNRNIYPLCSYTTFCDHHVAYSVWQLCKISFGNHELHIFRENHAIFFIYIFHIISTTTSRACNVHAIMYYSPVSCLVTSYPDLIVQYILWLSYTSVSVHCILRYQVYIIYPANHAPDPEKIMCYILASTIFWGNHTLYPESIMAYILSQSWPIPWGNHALYSGAIMYHLS